MAQVEYWQTMNAGMTTSSSKAQLGRQLLQLCRNSAENYHAHVFHAYDTVKILSEAIIGTKGLANMAHE
jgi:hypothetical protein